MERQSFKRTVLPAAIFVAMLVAMALLPKERRGFQELAYKIMLPNAGFLNAHIIRKLAFPKVQWEERGNLALKLLIIVLYAAFIYGYAIGG